MSKTIERPEPGVTYHIVYTSTVTGNPMAFTATFKKYLARDTEVLMFTDETGKARYVRESLITAMRSGKGR